MKLSLLSPAGDWDSLLAAVQNGADAVYLGGRAYNARRFAGNFDDGALQKALDYCHLRNVAVHVAFNTLLLDRELPGALSYAAFLYEAGADALIVQDLGLARMVRSEFPDFPLHASTQLGVHDEGGLRLCERLGIRRAVLARELSLARVRSLAGKTAVELECFAHGALCTAMSGACLFSSLAGGRSGNRGACAQPCRKPYALDGGREGYPLSLADLCMLMHVGELASAGVACVKLEGRMKRAEYVAAMTRAYRMAIDGAGEEELASELRSLRRIYWRGASTGYYYGNDVPAEARGTLSDGESPLAAERETYRGERRKRPVDAKLELTPGEPALLTLTLGEVAVSAAGESAQTAEKPQDPARYAAQIGKLGDTPFSLSSCAVEMPAPAFLPVSALNALRRDAVDALTEKLRFRREPRGVSFPAAPPHESRAPEVLAIVPDAARAAAAFGAGADIVALEPREPARALAALQALQAYRAEGRKLYLGLPAADFSGNMRRVWEECFFSGLLDGGVAQNAGQAELIRGERVAGYLCNAANAQAAEALFALGFGRVLLSLELNGAQMGELLRIGGVGVYGYGRAQLMQLWHCPRRRETGCAGCGDAAHALTDSAGRSFPLDPVREAPGRCLNRLRNCEVMDILDELRALPAPALLALEFVRETEDEVGERVRAARAALSGGGPPRRGTTRGHFARGLAT